MGQAVVDLPDPLEEPPAASGSADDLLSQLAGDEIDRLLTEADVENADAPAIDAAPGTAEAVSTDVIAAEAPLVAADATPPAASTHSAVVSTVTEPLATSRADAAPESPAAPPTVEAPGADAPLDTAALKSVLDTPAAPVAAEPAVAAADLDHAIAAQADAVLPPQTAEIRAEVAALEPKPETVEAAETERQVLLAEVAHEAEDTDESTARLPLWLRPLEWLNAPIEALSDTTREFLGKAAILTLVNSAAVIVYVMIFRRH